MVRRGRNATALSRGARIFFRHLQPEVLIGMAVQRGRVPALHRGMQQIDLRVVVDREDREFVHQDLFHALIKRETLLVRRRGEGLHAQCVVLGVGPAGIVVAAARDKDLEKRVRVQVVGDPAASAQAEIQRILRIQVTGRF